VACLPVSANKQAHSIINIESFFQKNELFHGFRLTAKLSLISKDVIGQFILMRTDQLINVFWLHAREALIHGGIWSFIGLLYAIIFTSTAVFAQKWGLIGHPYFYACIMAGTIGALMYSSMRLVVFIALLLLPVYIIYFINTLGGLSLVGLLKLMIPAGLLIGAGYGAISKRSRVKFADAKTLAGLSAGLIVAVLFFLAQKIFGNIHIVWAVGIACPLTGGLYIMLVPPYIRMYHGLLPPIGDGALVGASVAFFISLCLFVMAGTIDTNMTGDLIPEIAKILELLPGTTVGGVLGAGIAGVIAGMLLTNWQNRE
jgi:hypothetical protein